MRSAYTYIRLPVDERKEKVKFQKKKKMDEKHLKGSVFNIHSNKNFSEKN